MIIKIIFYCGKYKLKIDVEEKTVIMYNSIILE